MTRRFLAIGCLLGSTFFLASAPTAAPLCVTQNNACVDYKGNCARLPGRCLGTPEMPECTCLPKMFDTTDRVCPTN